MHRKDTAGFTLIELLVVVAIIGLLSTLAVTSFQNARMRARDTRRTADMRNTQTALELFNNDYDGYPTADPAIDVGTGNYKALCGGGWKAACNPGDTVYIGLLPAAPTPNDGSCTAAQNSYTYFAPAGQPYTLSFCLGGQTGYLSAGAHIGDPNGIQ